MKSRRSSWRSVAAVALFGAALSACGGSGGGGAAVPQGNPPPPSVPAPTSEDLANASASQVGVVLKADSKEIVISWTDTFAAETGYRVERQIDGGAWESQESLSATPGTGVAYTWQRVVDRSATYRVVAERTGYVVPLSTSGGQSSVSIDLATSAPELLVDQQLPLHGVVQLSVQNAGPAQSVQYFADLASIGGSTAGTSFPLSWNSGGVADGSHLLLATVTYASGLVVELRRTVTVDNPNVAVTLSFDGMYEPVVSGVLGLKVRASSDAGVSSVQFLVNDQSLAILTNGPNYSDYRWYYALDTRTLPAAPATIKIVVIDNEGDQAEVSRVINVDNLPVMSVASPVDGAVVSGTLQVQASVTDDLPGTVLSASLGDVPLFETTNNSIVHNYSLAGIPSRQYTLTVRARDSGGRTTVIQRPVIVTNTAFTYELVGSYQESHTLLDTNQGKLLYRTPEGAVHVRRADGTEVSLQGAADILQPFIHADTPVTALWHLSGDRVSTVGRRADGSLQVHIFDSVGARQEIPYAVQTGEAWSFFRSGLHGAWLVWGIDRIFLRNLDAQGSDIGPIDGRLLYGHAFNESAGSEQLFFSRAGSPVHTFAYDVTGGITTQLSGSVANSLDPKTDGTRVAWKAETGFAGGQPFGLVVAPVSNPTAGTVRSTTMSNFDLQDGLLAWVETGALKVDDGVTETTVSTSTSAVLYSVSGGAVVFSENGKLYIWSSAQGRRVLLDTLPKQLVHGGNVVYFATGATDTTIYRTSF